MIFGDLREIDTYASIFYDLPIIVAHLGGEYLYDMVDICRQRSEVLDETIFRK